jgi:hypothetical protein
VPGRRGYPRVETGVGYARMIHPGNFIPRDEFWHSGVVVIHSVALGIFS